MAKSLITSRTRLVAACTGLLVLLAGTVLATPMGPVAAAGAQTISFAASGSTPAGPFPDGTPVMVTVAGFAPNTDLLFAQCPAGIANHAEVACETPAMTYTTDAAGTAAGIFVVTVGVLNNAAHTLCDPSHPCDFNVTRRGNPGYSDLSQSAAVAIPMTHGTGEDTDPLPGTGSLAVSYSPGGVVTAGQEIVVTATGLSPFAPVMVGQCAAGRPLRGPGDCGPSSRGTSRLTTANASGVVRATLVAVVGPMLNQTPPATLCSSNDGCDVVVINIANVAERATTPLVISAKVVAPKVGVALTKSSVTRGKATTFTGKVGPNQARQKVKLQRKVGKRWVSVTSSRLGMNSRYTVTLRPRSRKDYYWRVLLPRTAFHKAATSKRKKLRVR